jgi:hypothetical protein
MSYADYLEISPGMGVKRSPSRTSYKDENGEWQLDHYSVRAADDLNRDSKDAQALFDAGILVDKVVNSWVDPITGELHEDLNTIVDVDKLLSASAAD